MDTRAGDRVHVGAGQYAPQQTIDISSTARRRSIKANMGFEQQLAIGAKGETAAIDLFNLDLPGHRRSWKSGLKIFIPPDGLDLYIAICRSLEPDADFIPHQRFRTSPGWEGDAARIAERLCIGRRQWDFEAPDGQRGECKYDRLVWEWGNFYIQTRPNGLFGPEGENPLWAIVIGNSEDKPCCVLIMPRPKLKELVTISGRFTPTRDGKREGYLVEVNSLLRYMVKI